MLVVALAVFAAPLTACNVSKVRVRLRSFASGNVDGLWFWRYANGAYQRSCRFDFSNIYKSGGREVVDYQQSCVNGVKGAPWQAVVERRTTNPDTIDLVLTYRPITSKKTEHRASAFSNGGESALSTSSILL